MDRVVVVVVIVVVVTMMKIPNFRQRLARTHLYGWSHCTAAILLLLLLLITIVVRCIVLVWRSLPQSQRDLSKRSPGNDAIRT